MQIAQLLQQVKDLNLPQNEYAIFGSATLAIRNLRESPNIDLIVTNQLWTKLLETYTPDDEGFIRTKQVKISNWWFAPTKKSITTMINEAEIIEGLPFVKLDDVLSYKQNLNRDKDIIDVKLIKNFLRK